MPGFSIRRFTSFLTAGFLAGALAAVAHAASMRLVTGDTGWFQEGNRLLWTGSSGFDWKDITPAGPSDQAISGIFFLNPTSGWLTRAIPGGLVEILRTQDSGQSWQAAALPLDSDDRMSFGNVAAIHFLDPSHGWAMLRRASTASFSLGMLLATSDGGATWQRLPDPPLGDPVRFVTTIDGWIAGGPRGDQLYVTRDGGQSWQSSQIGELTGVRYTLPNFSNTRMEYWLSTTWWRAIRWRPFIKRTTVGDTGNSRAR